MYSGKAGLPRHTVAQSCLTSFKLWNFESISSSRFAIFRLIYKKMFVVSGGGNRCTRHKLVLGQYPPGQYPPGQYPPDNIPPDKIPQDKTPPDKFPSSNIPPDNIPPDDISSKTCVRIIFFNSSVLNYPKTCVSKKNIFL